MNDITALSPSESVGEEPTTPSAFDTPDEFKTPDGDEFITAKQAVVVTGVTDRSIQRYVKEVLNSGDVLAKSAIRREILQHGGFRYRISKRAVIARFKNITKTELREVERPAEKQSKEVVELYKKAVAALERERESLVEQLGKKDEQIHMLEEARTRSDILLQQTNERVKLLETPKKKHWWSWSK